MADDRKYYYLKLKDNFFEREEITVIESMPNGYKYSNILLKMYLKSLKREGKLMVTDYIPYNLQTLSAVLKHDEDTLRTAIDLFKEFRLIEVLDNGQIYMNDLQNFVGLSSTEADRKREYRAKIEDNIKSLPNGQMSDKCQNVVRKKSDKNPPEIEIKIEKELKNIYSDEFEMFWLEYPKQGHQNSKPQSFKNFKTLLKKKVDSNSLIQSARNYATDCKTLSKTEYLYKASNFIGQAEYYKSYLDEVWEPAQQELFTNKRELTIAEKAKQLEEEYERRNGISTNSPNKGYISVL